MPKSKLKRLWREFRNTDPIYWFRSLFINKYHLVDIRNDNFEPYRYGWIDRDKALLIANFKILADFMELEEPGKIIDWTATPEHEHAWKEMSELYEWWKTGRKEENDALDALLDDLPHRKFSEAFEEAVHEGKKVFQYIPEPPEIQQVYTVHRQQEELLIKKDQEMLHRLIEIRHYLWT